MSEYNHLDNTKRSVVLILFISLTSAFFITYFFTYAFFVKSHAPLLQDLLWVKIKSGLILFFPSFILSVTYWYFLIDDVKSLKIHNFGFVIRIIIAIILTPIFIILSLLGFDIFTFLNNPTDALYLTSEIQNIFFSIYKGTIVILALFVSCYVAYTRNKSLKQAQAQFVLSQEQFMNTKEQFNNTQIQKLNEEVEKRFQEGIKLLGNENESVRLGGIYILWEIVKDAVKGLPYLNHDAHVKLFYSIKRKELNNDYKENNSSEISAYKKAHSLHVQILDILCAHIRTQTNSENYLKQYYPSTYKIRYPKQFKDAFGGDGEHNFLAPKDEKPSNEIQTLLNLLTKSKSNKKLDIPNYQLGFVLNFERAVLGGANCNKAHFEGANCNGTYFTYSSLYEAHFEYSGCQNAHFEDADCVSAHFEHSKCVQASFENAACADTNFDFADCKEANFECTTCAGTCFNNAQCNHALFTGATMSSTVFPARAIQHCSFIGVNSLLGECGVLQTRSIYVSTSRGNAIEVNSENKNQIAQDFNCPSLKMDKPWRISITEVERYLTLDLDQDTILGIDFAEKNLEIKNYLINFQKAYEKSNNNKNLFFKSLNPEEQKLSRYYLNDFGDQELEPEPETAQQN